MPIFTVVDAKDAPLLPGMRRIEMPDGTYRVLMPWEMSVTGDWKAASR